MLKTNIRSTIAMQMRHAILSYIMKYYREYYRLSPQPILDPSNLLLHLNTQYSISDTIEYYRLSPQPILDPSNLQLIPIPSTQYLIL